MDNYEELNYIKLDLFRSKNIKYISEKSFKLEFEIDDIHLSDININICEDDIKSLIRKYGMDKYYKDLKDMPLHMQYKIGNSRKNNSVDKVMKLIHNDFENYAYIFSEFEVYNDLSLFFNEFLDEILKIKLDLNNNSFKYYKYKEVIIYLLHNSNFKNQLNIILSKYGIPFLTRTCKRKNKIVICIDNFIILGLLISVLKRLLFEDYNSSNKIFNFFNLKDVNKSNLSVILEKIIYNCFIENIIYSCNSSFIDKFEMYSQTKTIKTYINLFDFYFQCFNYNYEYDTKEFRKTIKNEECELIRKYYINKINGHITKGQEKKLKSIKQMSNTELKRKYRKDSKEGRI